VAKLRAAIEQAKEFAIRLGGLTPSREEGYPFERPFLMFSNHELGGLRLTGDEAREYGKLESQIHELTRGVISERGSSNALQHAFLKTLDIMGTDSATPLKTRADHAFKELEQELTSPPSDWATFIPLLGITIPKRPWHIGDVAIASIKAKVSQALLDKVERVILSGTDSDEMKERTRQQIKRELLDVHVDQPFAIVRTKSIDAGAAWETAKRHLRFTLDCLNFIVGVMEPDSKHYIITDAQKARPYRVGLIVADDASYSSTHYERELMPINAKDFQQKIQRVRGLRRLLEYIGTDNPNGHQARVLSAIQWAGRGAVASRPEEAYLHSAIALESLILGRKDVELTNRLALSVTHLLGKWLVSRQKTMAQLKDLYGVRSMIVHSGKYEVDQQHLHMLREYVRRCFQRLLEHRPFINMRGANDLDDWLEARLRGDRK